MIELKNIKKNFGNTTVLKDVNLKIYPGEMVDIMGRSGAGKSTLLNILGLLTKPDSGKYIFSGSEITVSTDPYDFRKKNIGYILQKPNLIPDRNIYNNLLVGIDLYSIKKEYKKKFIDTTVSMLGIEKLMSKFPNDLSGGECQKVVIARTILYSKKVILADEPTGSLDNKSSVEIMNILKNLSNRGNTILIVTHDPIVANCCCRTITIDDGITYDLMSPASSGGGAHGLSVGDCIPH
ncbi:MAG: ABC transporter ATP-binding protein [Erysipelotrichaceae bacterium]|nr:ABC transporter ATP-binding protein [Erysipelotrichaceae bacterium]